MTFTLDNRFVDVVTEWFGSTAAALEGLGGATIERLGTLALDCPTFTARWNPSPAGYSKQPSNLNSWLATKGWAIYSATGNELLRHLDCYRMVDHLLRELRADDLVVVVDSRLPLGAQLLAGNFARPTPASLRARPDFRWANKLDVQVAFEAAIRPGWFRHLGLDAEGHRVV